MTHSFRLRLTLVASISLLGTGCSKSFSDKDVHWLSIEEAKEAMGTSSGSWFSDPMPNAWIDPRDAMRYKGGHVPGAINVQLSDPDAISQLEGYGILIVYGQGYEAPLADAMIKALLKDGQKEVKGLRVGFDGWKQAGQPSERGEDPRRSVTATRGDRWQRQPVDDQ
jgi:rhodanese-related sulfurtransferase